MPGRLQRVKARPGQEDDLTAAQLAARERWQRPWIPIVLAAFIPLFVTSPKSRAVEVAIGVGSWLVFLVDLVVQRGIAPDYLHRAKGRFDLRCSGCSSALARRCSGSGSEPEGSAASPGSEQVPPDGRTRLSVDDELATLRSRLVAVEHGLCDLAEHIRSLESTAGGPGA